jgi:NTE family protein
VAEKKADAVFEGGGVKGIGLVGALEVMEAAGYRWNMLAGTSAGAIVAALVAAGYTAAELKPILEQLDYSKFEDEGVVDRIPLFGPIASLFVEKGLYEGQFFEDWIRKLLAAKGVKNFGDLRAAPGSLYDHRLQVLVSDITESRILVVPSGLSHYGIDADSFDVAHGVRMSMSIPFFFEPIKDHDHYFVDGGLLSNFPVWLFDRQPPPGAATEPAPRWPTFGFKLVEPGDGQPNKINSVVDFTRALVTTMLESHDKQHVEEDDFLRTVAIPTVGVSTTEFTLAPEKRDRLYESGRQAATEFLATWDEEKYIRRARVPVSSKYKSERRKYRARIQEQSARMIGSRAYLR